MEASATTTWLARDRFARLADGLAVAVAVSLPWSTSATSILVGLWLLALLPTLDFASLRRALAHPAGGLPVALVVLAVVGMLWADVPFAERFGGIRGPHKLLMIPLLLVQFRRSDKGTRVIGGFLASCTALLAVSWVIAIWPSTTFWQSRWSGNVWAGVPVKDYLVQSGEFLICAFALTHLTFDAWRDGRRDRAVVFAALALIFLANIVFVATGRSSLVVFAVLVVIVGLRWFDWKGRLGVIVGVAMLAAAAWAASPYLRVRVAGVANEIASYRTTGEENSSGYRIEFWKKSVQFIAEAPIIGHGTGSIYDLFRHAAVGDRGAAAAVTGNPHNLTFEVAIQLGLIGVVMLYAMWGAQLMLFRGSGLAAWIGLGLVVQDIVSSLFLSHIFDFTTGWIYVFGVGVLGGMVLRGERSSQEARRSDPAPAGWRPAANAGNE
jgi:O-antigen ligase